MSKFKRFGKSRFKIFICQKYHHFMKDYTKKEDNEDYAKINVVSNDDNYYI